MKFLFAGLALTFSVFINASTTSMVHCNNCQESQYENVALQESYNFWNNTGTIFVLDYDRGNVRKFRTMSGEFDIQGIDPVADSLAQENIESDQVLSFSESPTDLSSGAGLNFSGVTIVGLTPTASEINAFNNYKPYHLTLKSGGFSVIVDGGSGFGSVYDIVGNGAAGIRLGNHIAVNNQFAFGWREALSQFTSKYPVIRVISQYNYTVNVTFADGSTATYEMQNGIFKPIDGEFYDSENNKIPVTSSQTNGQAYDFSSSYSNNFNEFLNRLEMLGIPITRVGGGGTGYSCNFSCNVSGCTLSCSRQ